MEKNQAFRLIETTETAKITLNHVDGQTMVHWDEIEQVFPGAKRVHNGTSVITFHRNSSQESCNCCSPSVIDVALSNTVEHSHADPAVALVRLRLANATDDGSSRTDEAVDLQVVASPAVKSFSEAKQSFQKIVKLASKQAQIFEIEQQLISSLDPDTQQKVQASLLARNLYVEAHNVGRVEDSERFRNELNGRLQELLEVAVRSAAEAAQATSLLAANQDALMNLQLQSTNSMETKQEEIKQLQIQSANAMLAKQDELNAKQDKITKMQIQADAAMKKMREDLMGQFAMLQSRIQAVLTQTYELHEYPIPRLFIVLPQYPSGWDVLKPFTEKYRLYFLCECGEHTKAVGSDSKLSHEVHLAKHEGYEISRPTEFFKQYGPYVLTLLKILKFGVSVASVAVPAVAHLINSDALDHTAKGLQHLKDCIVPGMDQVILKIEKGSVDEGESIENFIDQVENKEALEGADLRKLETFLKDKDGNKVLGNLYRTVTDKGHVKWVCMDHYRESYNTAATEALRRAVELAGGSYDENTGVVEVELVSKVQAEQFYAALEKARSVHELKIKLSWETTYGDFKKLRDTLRVTNISVLEFGYSGTHPASDYGNRNKRYDPIRHIMGHPSIRSFTMEFISDEFLRRSSIKTADIDFSNLKRLVIGGFGSNATIDKFKPVLFHAPNISNMSLVTPRRIFEGPSPWSKQASIFSDLTNMTVYWMEAWERVSIKLDMEMKLSNDSSLLLGVPRGFFETCSLWPSCAKFSSLKRLTVMCFEGDPAIIKFYMVNAPALTTLEMSNNSIKDDEMYALAEVLKTNKTLTTWDLSDNNIGDEGAQALAEALKTNKTLTTLDLRSNSIGVKGALHLVLARNTNSTLASFNLKGNKIRDHIIQALCDAFRANSTLTTLDLSDNSIGHGEAQALADALKTNSTLTHLNLSFNSIGDDGAQALAEALQTNSTLTTLDLWRNSIGNDGAQALAEALKTNSTVTTLDLRSNSIGHSGAQALAEALKTNSTLATLDLSDNSLGGDGAPALAEALKTNSTLLTLNLWRSSIGNDGAQALAEALKTNLTLTTLDLGFNSIGNDGAQALAEALKTNSTLTTFELGVQFARTR